MKQDSKGTYNDYEYKIELGSKLSADQIKDIASAIKKSPLFHRSYKFDGNTWYELRSPENQDIHKDPDANLLIGANYIYIMRETKAVWDDLSDLKRYVVQNFN